MRLSNLLIWAEASVAIGTGHVMRCLALAQAWKRGGGRATFVLSAGSTGLVERISAAGFPVESLRDGEAFATRFGSDDDYKLVVLDGYGFGAAEQAALSRAGVSVLFLDDYAHTDYYSARWVLNQNSYARPTMYAKRAKDTRLLLGPQYALLREEFQAWVTWTRPVPELATKILVTMGGSDAGNASATILKALSSLGDHDLDVIVAVGAGNPHRSDLRSATKNSPIRIRTLQSVSDMSELMAWADIAIAAAGGTAYELCYMGLPSILFVAAENQRPVAESLSDLGIANYGGQTWDFDKKQLVAQCSALIGSQARRTAMAEKGRKLVDGAGADRVRAALIDRELAPRPLKEGDCAMLYEWTSDPVARAASFRPNPISWEEHERWFAERIRDRSSVAYIGENRAGIAVGIVRFELEKERAILSINVAPSFRGQGWGRELIAMCIRLLARTHLVRRIDALVKPGNTSSMCLFSKAGFRQSGTEEIAGQPAVRFIWERQASAHVG